MIWSRSTLLSPSHRDRLLVWTLRGAAGVAGLILLFIIAFLILEALPALRTLGLIRFVTDPSWHPGEEFYLMLPMMWGTLFATLGAVVLATPLACCRPCSVGGMPPSPSLEPTGGSSNC